METYIMCSAFNRRQGERDKTIVGAARFMANRSNGDGNHLVPAIFYDERSPLCRTHAQPSIAARYTYANNSRSETRLLLLQEL